MKTLSVAHTSIQGIDYEYWQLVQAFPLITIRDDAHLEQALDIIDRASPEQHAE